MIPLLECNILCNNCTGRLSTQCLSCSDSAFQVDYIGPLKCVSSCNTLESYYPQITSTPKMCLSKNI